MSELLVTLFILLIIMVGVARMMESSWQSFSDLKWQNRVDSEARRALDTLCDAVRTGSTEADLYTSAGQNINGQINPGNSSSSYLSLQGHDTDQFYTEVSANNIPYLAHLRPLRGDPTAAALYINGGDIHFAYEYRLPSAPNNTKWTFDTVQGLIAGDPTTDPTHGRIFYTTKTIYITVTARYNPYPKSIDSRVYTRTLTGAVTLRGAYNAPVPPS